MLRIGTAAVWACGILACYPAYIRSPAPELITSDKISAAKRTVLNKELTDCRDQLDGARRNAYDLHRDSYNAGVFGSGATMITGAAAGGLGAGSQQALSGVAGGISLATGIVTLVLVNKQGIADAEGQQAKIYSAWDAMREAKAAYETAVLTDADQATQNKALGDFVAAVTLCGLQPPPGLTLLLWNPRDNRLSAGSNW